MMTGTSEAIFDRFSLAMAVAAFLLLALPSFASASSSLVWGDQNGGTPTQIEIFDGGTYAVPLNTDAPAYLVPSLIIFGPVHATLYRITGTAENPVREEMASLGFQNPDGDTVVSWPAAGSYEVDIFT